MTKWLLAVLLFTSQRANAFITVNEGLQTTNDAVYVGTTTPQVLLNGGKTYSGVIPSVSLKASSNVVVGSDACVTYSSGSFGCTGRISGGAFSGPGLSTGVATTAALSGNGMSPTPLGVVSSSVAVYSGSYGLLAASVQGVGAGVTLSTQITSSSSMTITATGAAMYDLTLSSGIQFITATTGIKWQDGSISTTASSGGGGSSGSSTMTITAVSDNFLGQVTGSKTSFTLSQTPANAAALSCILDGLLLSQTSDYTYTPPTTIAVTTAPAANSTGFFCNYFVNTSTLPAVFILNSSQTVSGTNSVTSTWTYAATSTITFTEGMGYSGIAGGIIASSKTISGATSTTISGLNGNRYGRIRIVVEGSLAATSDGTITKLHFNSDTTGYKSEGAFLYGGGAGAVALISNGLHLWRQYGTGVNPVDISSYFHSAVYSSGIQRSYNCFGGGSQVGTGGFSGKFGGAWTDTSSNLTSVTFDWGSAFTGNVYIYQD